MKIETEKYDSGHLKSIDISISLIPKGFFEFISRILGSGLIIFSVMTSWFYNHSILWAIFHGITNILYLIYVGVFQQGFADGKFMEIINYYI